jgi:hypothetical protein
LLFCHGVRLALGSFRRQYLWLAVLLLHCAGVSAKTFVYFLLFFFWDHADIYGTSKSAWLGYCNSTPSTLKIKVIYDMICNELVEHTIHCSSGCFYPASKVRSRVWFLWSRFLCMMEEFACAYSHCMLWRVFFYHARGALCSAPFFAVAHFPCRAGHQNLLTLFPLGAALCCWRVTCQSFHLPAHFFI